MGREARSRQAQIRFANRFRDAVPTDLPAWGVIPVPTVWSNAVEIEIVASNGTPAAAVVPWGTPVKGVAVSLRADHFAWTADNSATFSASVRNGGAETRNIAHPQRKLEIDGVWTISRRPHQNPRPRSFGRAGKTTIFASRSLRIGGRRTASPCTSNRGGTSSALPKQ